MRLPNNPAIKISAASLASCELENKTTLSIWQKILKGRESLSPKVKSRMLLGNYSLRIKAKSRIQLQDTLLRPEKYGASDTNTAR